MQYPFSFIVRPVSGKRYDNVKKIGDLDFLISVSKEDHKASNRYGQVVSVPICYKGEINIGDILLVNHNVFKYYNDMKGVERSGKSFFKDNLFFIDFDQFFMFKSKDTWSCHSKYCMVKPLPKKNNYLKTHQDEEPLAGLIKYTNDSLIEKGVNVGDKVYFQPDSEYEYNLDGEKLYRMFTNNITMVS